MTIPAGCKKREQAALSRPALPLAAESVDGARHVLRDTAFCLRQTPQLECLISVLRSRETSKADFIFYADRVIRLLVEEGLNCLPVESNVVDTPVGTRHEGRIFGGSMCGVSILRAGEAMENGLRSCARGAKIGKILIQRDEVTHQAKLFYAKLPADVHKRHCLLLDPMLATGSSVIAAVKVLLDHGVLESNIVFLNLLSSPEGLATVGEMFPEMLIITAKVDRGLNEVCHKELAGTFRIMVLIRKDKYIVPGMGDFGDRYF